MNRRSPEKKMRRHAAPFCMALALLLVGAAGGCRTLEGFYEDQLLDDRYPVTYYTTLVGTGIGTIVAVPVVSVVFFPYIVYRWLDEQYSAPVSEFNQAIITTGITGAGLFFGTPAYYLTFRPFRGVEPVAPGEPVDQGKGMPEGPPIEHRIKGIQ